MHIHVHTSVVLTSNTGSSGCKSMVSSDGGGEGGRMGLVCMYSSLTPSPGCGSNIGIISLLVRSGEKSRDECSEITGENVLKGEEEGVELLEVESLLLPEDMPLEVSDWFPELIPALQFVKICICDWEKTGDPTSIVEEHLTPAVVVKLSSNRGEELISEISLPVKFSADGGRATILEGVTFSWLSILVRLPRAAFLLLLLAMLLGSLAPSFSL